MTQSRLDQRSAQAAATLERIAAAYAPGALASSLSAEDMVLTDLIVRHQLPIEIFTLDTGRLHADTLAVIDQVAAHYGLQIRIHRPDPAAVARYAAEEGVNGFYQSVDSRKRCCAIRKVEPLRRALAGKAAWITGLRREQSGTRSDLALRAHDPVHGIQKFSPLADWTEQEVWEYIRNHGVPYNRLHDQGYRSIGCAPCSRPVTALEDARAGRWWWEEQGSRECGLHLDPEGRLVRARPESPLLEAPSA
jgi:phosphoadenosine phosphosulfate reductase